MLWKKRPWRRNIETRLQQLQVLHGVSKRPPRCRPKGSHPTFAKAKELQPAHTTMATYKIRKLRNLVGRLRELQQQYSRGHTNTTTLEEKIRRTWPATLPACTAWTDKLQAAETALSQQLVAHKQQRLQAWRDTMRSRSKAASRWLRGEILPPIQSITTPHGKHHSPHANIQAIRAYWTSIWQRPPPNIAQASQTWQQHASPSNWEPTATTELWTPTSLWQQARRLRGTAAGPDGWSGNDIAMWPPAAWEVYSTLLHRKQAVNLSTGNARSNTPDPSPFSRLCGALSHPPWRNIPPSFSGMHLWFTPHNLGASKGEI